MPHLSETQETPHEKASAACPADWHLRHPGRLLYPSLITLNDGREIQAVDAPKYDRDAGFYEFQQLDGKRTRINKDQVRTISDL